MKQHGRVVVICLLASVQSLAALAAQGVGRLLYTVPDSGFIEDPSGDDVVTVNDASGSVSTLQAAIDRARSANPGAFVVVRLARGSTYSVTSAGLVLGSKESLVAEGAVIRAASSSVTVPLITIAAGSSKVSVAGGTLDGNGANIRGIDVPAASRVNVDRVTVRNCRLDGIRLSGEGNTTFNNEMTVTRSEVLGSTGGAGIRVENSTQTVLIDNHAHDNAVGIRLSGAWASVVNNICNHNGIGIEIAGGSDNIVGNNTCNNNATGIRAAGTKAMIVSNSLSGNTTAGMASVGTSNNFIDNRFATANATNFSSAGATNNIIAYKAPLNAPGQNYFYPPLIDDQHTRTIVNGMGRTDVTITSTTMATVQSRYDSARAANPNNVIVLHLNGSFVVGPSPLILSSNTVILLNGTVQINSATTATAAFRANTGQTRISISGGILDGGNRNGRKGVHVPSGSMIQVDAMTIRNFGDNASHHGGSESIHFSGGATPYAVTRCTIDKSGSRGIWAQTSGQKALYSANTVRATRSCIDCDSHTFGAVMLFNRCYDNTYGIFIEQGAAHNTAIGNVVNDSARPNIEIFNNDNTPPVRFSTVACNTVLGGGAGIRTGSTPAATLTSWNFVFNNVALNATVRADQAGEENYFSQTYLDDTSTQTNSGAGTIFNSPDVEGHQYIQDRNSGLALVVADASIGEGAAVVTGRPTGRGEDEWRLFPTEGGHYRVQNRRSGLVMGVSGASTAAGAAVVQTTYDADATYDDEWLIQSAGGGLHHVVNRRSGLYLTGGGVAAGTPLTQQRPNGAASQRFSLTENAPLAPGFVEITPGAASVTASANDGNVPGNAVDENLVTRWSAMGDEQWIQLDLGTTRTVGFVKIAFHSGDARQARFDLQTSTDGTTWTNALTGATSSGTSLQEQTFDFSDRPARYVRYLGHGNTVNTWNSLTELGVFAPLSAR